ncbi:hypothetical protein SAMD00023353_0103650 [Rosellinia necatrix]|uniref:Uncharacterized protein n=1 Tax=Rosellinia necatrix TaxID=77044 RepID=A0A1S8A5C0_ROSNE|nr:hypothetical protein SAMD00023353_0103650 [Rosellinia necatrix]
MAERQTSGITSFCSGTLPRKRHSGEVVRKHVVVLTCGGTVVTWRVLVERESEVVVLNNLE